MDKSYNVPELQNCCGCLRLRFAAFLISFVAISSGCFGLTAIVIYCLAEQYILTNFLGGHINRSLRKIIVPVFFITSSMLTCSGWLTLVGAMMRGRAVLTWAVCTMVAMCNVVLVAVIGAPLSCFFSTYCITKDLPVVFLMLFFFIVTAFLLLWLYFILAVYSFRREVTAGV